MSIHIALLMMVKNESKRINVSLNSVLGYVDSIIIYDTGSTDNTLEIIKNFSKKHNIPLHLKEGEFVNFCISRNVSLDFANSIKGIDYFLLLDTNDELRGGDILRQNCEFYKNKKNTGFLVSQEWWSGCYDKYYNIRLIKAYSGWKYFGRVHEWMKNTKYENDEEAIKNDDNVIKLNHNIILFQDRTQDDDKSGKRFFRDKELLLEDHLEDPKEPRTVFYLAQTCSCLRHLEDSFYYYKLRTILGGFWEEVYHSFYRCGELSEVFKHPWEESMKWYIKAFEQNTRVEPLLKIAEHYKGNNWLLSYTFVDLACKLTYPENCILFIDKQAYDYKRWNLLGICGWNTRFYNEGKIGCLKAIETGINVEVDRKILRMYEEYENKNLIQNPEKINKKEFVEHYFSEIKKNNPELSEKKIHKKIEKLWKNRIAL